MAKITHSKVSITWPNDEENIKLLVEDEDPEVISDIAAYMISSHWDIPSGINENAVPWGEIDYPDKTRVYVDGKRVSLQQAHDALESALIHAVRHVLDKLDKEAKATTNQQE